MNRLILVYMHLIATNVDAERTASIENANRKIHLSHRDLLPNQTPTRCIWPALAECFFWPNKYSNSCIYNSFIMTAVCPNSFFNAFVEMSEFEADSGGKVDVDRKSFLILKRKGGKKLFFVKEEKGITNNGNSTKTFLREVETQLLLAHRSFSLFRGFCIRDNDPSPRAPRAGRSQSAFYFFEFIERGSLRTVMNSDERKLSATEAACIIVGLPFLVEYMHSHNMAHRDIKPENILVDDQGHPWLTDFGCARELDSRNNKDVTRNQGTGLYKSPQMTQEEGKLDTFKADIFSLGVVLAEAATGQYPFAVDEQNPAKSIEGKVDVYKLDYQLCMDLFGTKPGSELERLMVSPDCARLARVIAESADLHAPGRVIQGPLLDIIKQCLKPLESGRPTATELREKIEKLKPNELISWDGKLPDEETVTDYMNMMRRDFLSKQ